MKASTMAALAVIVFAGALFLAFYAPRTVYSREDAVNFVLADLRSDPVFSGKDARFSIFSTDYSNATGEWTLVVKITENPRGACPGVTLRTYDLFPIRKSLDYPVVSSCSFGTPLAYPEEAVIASRADPTASAIARAGGKACGFSLPLQQQELADCQELSSQMVSQAALEASAQSRWLAAWFSEPSNQSLVFFVGLSENGAVVFTKRA